MKKTRIKVKVSALQLNEGQLSWLPKNPRQWTQTDIDKTVESLKRDPDFLEDRPLDIVPAPQKGEFVVFCGNLRTTAADILGWDEADAYLYEPERATLEEDRETVRRRAILDNGQFGSWDSDELANWGYEAADLAGFGVPGFVYGEAPDEGGKEDAGDGAGGSSNEAHEDDFDENTDEIHVRCKLGDIWELGDHRLLCGDSIDLQQVKTLMGGAKADMVLTDPPYGTTQLAWDETPDLSKMFTCLISHSKDNAALLIFGTQPFVTDLINAKRDLFKYEIVWEKTQATGFFNAKKAPLRIHENIIVFYDRLPTYNPIKTIKEDCRGIGRKRGNSDYRKVTGGFMGKVGLGKADTWEYTEDGTRYPSDVIKFSNWNGVRFGNKESAVVHPTQKPVDLVAYLIETYSNNNDSVLDIFGGSGTTLIASEQLGRKCYMMELDPHYCDVIIARWEKLTGKTAVKLN